MSIVSRIISYCFIFTLFFTVLFFTDTPNASAFMVPQAAHHLLTTDIGYDSFRPGEQFFSPVPTVANDTQYSYSCSQNISGQDICFFGSNLAATTDIYYCYPPVGNGGDVTIPGGLLFYGCQKDITQPSGVPNVSASPSISPSAINISWQPATDNIGVLGYRVLVIINGVFTQIGTVLSTGAASYAFTDGSVPIAPATLASGRTLTPNTSYIYGVVAYDASGNPSSFVPVTGTTLNGPPPPTVTTNAASSPVGSTSATLNSSINPNGFITNARYLYSTINLGTSCSNTSIGTFTPNVSLGSGSLAVNNSQTVSVFSPGTTYWYCAIASNSGGTTYGNVQSFTTLTVPPTVSLTANPTTIISGSSTTLSWTSTGATVCNATTPAGWTTSTGTVGSQSVTPTGTTTYTISCTGAGGTTPASVVVTVNTPPTVTLTATPASIVSGSSSILSWSSTNATTCSATWMTGSATTGTQVVIPTGTTTYTISCTGAGGTTPASATVTVNLPPTVTLTANPTSVVSGSPTTLSWSSTNATRCDAVTPAGWTTSIGTVGNQSVTPTGTTTYTISCTGPGGAIPASATVTVVPPAAPTVSLTANPTTIISGSSTTLSWTSTGATVCNATTPVGWTTSTGTVGSQSVTPAGTTTYTISCTGAGGTTPASAVVTVNTPPTVTLTATPASIVSGSSSILSWSSTNATRCDAVTPAGWTTSITTTGSQSVTPTGTTTYTISCTGAGGTVSASRAVTVNPPPTVSLTASPSAITAGSSSTLSWSSTGTTACSATWTASTTTTGSQSVIPTGTTTYTISCTAIGGGTVSASATVTVAIINTLSIITAGTGTGSVTSVPTGISCPTSCATSLQNGTAVTLSESPAPGFTFAGWSGVCTGTAPTCTFSLTANSSVTATFNDITAPIFTLTAPLSPSFPSGTISVILSGSTNEAATCNYSIPNGTGTLNFNTTGARSHSQTLTVASGTTYTYNIQCADAAGNTSTPVSVMFSVASLVVDTTPPVISGGQPSGTIPSGTTSETLRVVTNKSAYCKYGTADVAYASMPNTLTNADPTHFSAPLTGLTNGASYTYYVRCTDNPGGYTNTSSYIVSFTVATPGNEPPVALFSATPTNGFAPLAVSVDASASCDPVSSNANAFCDPAGISYYIWNWGDGSLATTSTSALNAHTYTRAGTYTISLIVVDNGNLSTQSGFLSNTVTVSAVPPQPTATTVCTAACTVNTDCIAPNICGPAGVCINPAGVGGGPLRFDAAFTSVDGVTTQYTPAQFPGNTTSLIMSLRTNTNATCQYILQTPNTNYGAPTMTQFTKTGGVSHTVKISGLRPGGDLITPAPLMYNYYVKCKSSATGDVNTTDFPVSVTINGANIVTPVGDYLCLVNQSFVKNSVPYFFDVCLRKCTADTDCLAGSTCDTVKKICR